MRILQTFDTYPPENLGFMWFLNSLTQWLPFSRPPEQLPAISGINPGRGKKPPSRFPILEALATH